MSTCHGSKVCGHSILLELAGFASPRARDMVGRYSLGVKGLFGDHDHRLCMNITLVQRVQDDVIQSASSK
jgi:hypothetical protein